MNDLTNEKRMTVQEIAKAMGVPERTVSNLVASPRYKGLGIRAQGTRGGSPQRMFDEQEVALISAELKKAHNVDPQRKLATTKLEEDATIARAMQILHDRIAEQQRALNEATPKIEFYDAVAGSKDAISMAEVAKVLDMGIGRNKLFGFLRDQNVLQQNNIPYQRYVDAGYFRLIEQKYTTGDGETHINLKTVVYQRGVDFIRRLVEAQYEQAIENSQELFEEDN